VIEDVSERTGGVPLFVEEVTRLLLEREEQGGAQAIPPTLQQSLAARLDRLGPAREIAQIGAVLGRDFTYALLASLAAVAVSGLDPESGPAAAVDGRGLQSALDRLIEADIFIVEGVGHKATYRFKHALIQDAAYDSLLTRRRLHYHRAIADAIVESHPDIVATQPELVARHYTEGRRDDLALPYWKKAGERALERSANHEACDHFSNALALSERLADGPKRSIETLAARLRLAEALNEAGRFKEATTHYLIAAEQARESNDTDSFVRIALGYDAAQFLLGVPLDQSVALLTEAEAKIARQNDKQRCLILSGLARAHLLLGDAQKSASFHRRGTELAPRLGDHRSLYNLFFNRFLVPRQIQSLSDAQSRLSEVTELLELSQSVNDRVIKAQALFWMPISRRSLAIAPA
jgi:predicted ATPase